MKNFFLTLFLFVLCFTVFASQFSFEIKDILNVKIKYTKEGLFELQNIKLIIEKNKIILTEKKFEINLQKWSFAVLPKGGGKISIKLKNFSFYTSFVTTDENNTAQSWFYNEREEKSSKVFLTETSFNTKNLEIKIENRLDKYFGVYTNLSLHFRVKKKTFGLDIIKNYNQENETQIKITTANLSFVYKNRTGQVPVYGGTARTQKTEIQSSVKIPCLTFQCVNISETYMNTGTEKKTELSLTIKKNSLEMEGKTIFKRTEGAPYSFGAPKIKLKIIITKEIGLGEFKFEISENRKINVFFSSKTYNSFPGELRFTGNIDP